MPFLLRPNSSWQLRTRQLALGPRTLVMGIVNATPDSFSGEGTVHGAQDAREACERAVERALRHLDEGADLLDLGGESTRPGSGAATERAISTQEEQDRLLPVLEALQRERPEAILSADTYRAATAAAALRAGAEIINDVSGFTWEPAMAEVCARAGCGVVLMHTRGRPDEWRTLPPLRPDNIVPLVREGLRESLGVAESAGVLPERIVLDPGYGFGKAWAANYALLHEQEALLTLGRPLLAGLSRKSFLGRTLGETLRQVLPANAPEGDVPTSGREHATIAACVTAVLAGASILRVHSVRPAVEAAAVADAVLRATQ